MHRQLLPGDLAPTARIAFNRAFGHIRNDEIDPSGIHRMRIDGSRIRKVSLPATRAAVDVEPQWSPDGKQIVSVRHNATAKPAGAQAVFVIKAHGTARRRVTPYRIKAWRRPRLVARRLADPLPQPPDRGLPALRHLDDPPRRHHSAEVPHAGPQTKVYSASFSPDGTAITLRWGVAGDPTTSPAGQTAGPAMFSGWPIWAPTRISVRNLAGQENGLSGSFATRPRRPAAALHRLPLTRVQAVVLVVKPGTPAADEHQVRRTGRP